MQRAEEGMAHIRGYARTHMLVHETALRDGAIFVRPFGEEAMAVRPVLHSRVPHEQGVIAGTYSQIYFFSATLTSRFS